MAITYHDICKGLNCVFLFLLSEWDRRRRVVPSAVCLFYTLLAVPAGFIGQEFRMAVRALACLAVQAGLLFLPWPFAGVIGAGDVMAFLCCVSFTGWNESLHTIMTGLMLSSVYALFQLVVKKADRKKTFPFVPFLFLGQLLSMILA